jgi:SAM-dependent methyltransferase
MNNVKKREDCRLCGSQKLELAVPIRPCPVGDAYVTKQDLHTIQDLYPMDLHLCMDCYHLQLLHVVNPEILFGNYTYTTSSSPGLVNHFENYCKDVTSKLNFSKPGFVMEIGSNDGTLLNFFRQKGHNVLGIDPAQSIAKKAIERGVETWPRFFNSQVADEVLGAKGSAQLVCANNVFAHADDMMGIASGIRKLLQPDGVFVFEVSYICDLVEKNVFDTIYHEHLCHHSIHPLESFLRKFGMMLFDVERNASKGGSIRCFAQRTDGPRIVSPVIQQLKEQERAKGYDKLQVYADFAKRLEKMRDDLHIFLDAAKAQGKKIAGYGASNPNTTILFHLELGEYFKVLYDDNPVKQGMYSPRLHIPVVSSEQIYQDKPDYIVLLAWAYADRIGIRHEKFLRELGGRFIAPIPEVRIIG